VEEGVGEGGEGGVEDEEGGGGEGVVGTSALGGTGGGVCSSVAGSGVGSGAGIEGLFSTCTFSATSTTGFFVSAWSLLLAALP